MDKLNLKQQDATQALKTLKEILEEPFTIIVRDASIQRFEYTFEAIWKFIKSYLETIEGIQAPDFRHKRVQTREKRHYNFWMMEGV